MEVKEVDNIVEKYDSEKSALTSILSEIQDEWVYLHKDALKRVAESTRAKLTRASYLSISCFLKILVYLSSFLKYLVKENTQKGAYSRITNISLNKNRGLVEVKPHQ